MRGSFAALLLVLLAVPATAQISEEARRDLLLIEMAEAAMGFEHVRFLELLQSYEASGGMVEPEMRFYQAAALADGGEVLEAFNLVTEFINRMGSAHPLYRQALELFTRLEAPATVLLEEARLEQQRRDTLLQAPLYTALADGQRLLQVQRFTSPSPWRDGSSPQDFVNGIPGTVQRVEVHQGLLPRPDGGWIAFGQRPKAADAPEPVRARSMAAIRNGTHEPQDTYFPQAAILRFGADGGLQSTRHIDWRQVYARLLQATRNAAPNRMGLYTIPEARGLRVVSISPIRNGVETDVQVGDIITHINRRPVQADQSIEGHLEKYRGRRPPPIRVLRDGEALDLSLPPVPGFNLIEVRPGGNTPWRWTVLAYLLDTAEMTLDKLGSDPALFRDWTSEIIAMVPGAGDRVTLCANIETDHAPSYWSGSYGTLQVGVVLRGRLDDTAPGGVELENVATITHDHPWSQGRRQWWYDSGLIDCVGLPDGSLLTVSRASRTRSSGNNGLDGASTGDVYHRIVRLYDADGRYVGYQQFSDQVPQATHAGLQRFWYSALQPQLRLQPAGDGSGQEWRWQQFLVQLDPVPEWGFVRRVAVLMSAGTSLVQLEAPRAAQLDEDYQLVLNGELRQALLPRHAADHVQLKRAVRRADGSYVVLLGVQQNEIAIGQEVPGGQLGDVNGARVRDYFETGPDQIRSGQLRPVSHLAGQEDFLVGLGPDGRLLWSLRLVPEAPVEPDFEPLGNGRSRQLAAERHAGQHDWITLNSQLIEVGRLLMQEWTNLAVLADDSILVTMRNGHGLRVRAPAMIEGN